MSEDLQALRPSFPPGWHGAAGLGTTARMGFLSWGEPGDQQTAKTEEWSATKQIATCRSFLKVGYHLCPDPQRCSQLSPSLQTPAWRLGSGPLWCHLIDPAGWAISLLESLGSGGLLWPLIPMKRYASQRRREFRSQSSSLLDASGAMQD